jgi:hypothetical protein
MGMKVKYNRTSTINQTGERYKLDKEEYDLTLFDKGVSGKVPFKEREKGKVLVELIQNGEVEILVVEELSRLGRNTVDVQVLFHKLEPRNLSAAYKYYTGGTLENAHSALIDTQATYDVFKGMFEKYKDEERALPTSIEEIETMSSYGKRADLIGNLQYNEEGDMVFGFGKHKGVKVADVLTREPGYFGWMMNADFPLYTKEVLRKFRNNMMA